MDLTYVISIHLTEYFHINKKRKTLFMNWGYRIGFGYIRTFKLQSTIYYLAFLSLFHRGYTSVPGHVNGLSKCHTAKRYRRICTRNLWSFLIAWVWFQCSGADLQKCSVSVLIVWSLLPTRCYNCECRFHYEIAEH